MLLQQVVNGLTLGAVYTLIALSFSLVMGILSILNLAIGELFMLGGFVGFSVIAANFPLPVALLAGMTAGALTAIVIGKIGCEPLRNAPPIAPLLSTLGFSIILQNIVTNVWGSDPLQLPSEMFDERLTFGSLNIGVMQIAIIGITIVLVGVLAKDMTPLPGEVIAYGRRVATYVNKAQILYTVEGRNSSVAISNVVKLKEA